jgi:hypothetical protein
MQNDVPMTLHAEIALVAAASLLGRRSLSRRLFALALQRISILRAIRSIDAAKQISVILTEFQIRIAR